ncbi:hypothetical protein CLOP_g6860 [Closterium sp. NIES-67]|nr:hypothetical protein CLOP_g6860 [Closterium sp. NIES-67]
METTSCRPARRLARGLVTVTSARRRTCRAFASCSRSRRRRLRNGTGTSFISVSIWTITVQGRGGRDLSATRDRSRAGDYNEGGERVEALEAVKAEARRAVKSGEEASIRVQTDLLDELGAPIETRESRERRGIAAQEGIGAEGEEERDEEETEEAYRERADARARREEAALDAAEEAALDAVGGRRFVAHVPLPDEKEIERMVVAKKKAELLSKYASEALVQEEEEAKELLNIKR